MILRDTREVTTGMSDNEYRNFINQLDQSLKYGFIHDIHYKNNHYSPKVLINNPESGEYVLNEIQNELRKSKSFCINVAFITTAGIGMLKTQLSDFVDKGGTGKILVSPYLGFNDPAALYELLKLQNIDVKMTTEEVNSHAKVYIFNREQEQSVIVGSSNLTHSALKLNYEWNVKLTSTDNGDFIKRTTADFDALWERSIKLTEASIKEYARNRKKLVQTDVLQEQPTQQTDVYPVIRPNNMQKEAVTALQSLRQKGAERALVISATGTGKTYLGAFDVKQYKPKRMLFLVHREQILRDAQDSFKQVIGFQDDESCIYKSGQDVSNKKYVFATVQSLSRDENLKALRKDLFDYIMVDEVHHAAAGSYQKIMHHFDPDFYLGLTATPERTDGQNIYELFHYNVAYEIRLHDALTEEMLTPFLYYGVTEMRKKDGELIDEKEDFSRLVTSERVEHLLEKIHYYEISSEKTRGLIFCSRNQEAEELSAELNKRGLRTVALSGKDSQEVREKEVQKLENDELDYILTVDIFNEGIDIPSLNQIVMLRNTQSSIVFIQQLGRGLRLHPKKEFVTIIDFIGNYKNNYLIPVALYGDKSFNKDNYRRHLAQNQLSGVTTINFEEVAQEQIFESITETKLSSMANLKSEYLDLKNRLGRTPMLFDYYRLNSLDPLVFFEDSRFKHYGEVIHKFEKGKAQYASLNDNESGMLRMIAFELLNGKRPHELLLLKLLIQKQKPITRNDYLNYLNKNQAEHSSKIIRSVERVLTLEFFIAQAQKKYAQPLITIEEKKYALSAPLQQALSDPVFYELIIDSIKTGLARSKKYPAGYTLSGLEIGQKYSRKDTLRLLLWDKDESSTVYGYRIKHQTCPIFINYHKSDEISDTTKYEDTFINEGLLHWYTRSNLTKKATEVQDIMSSDDLDIDLHILVKREESEGTDFYYLGQASYNEGSAVDHEIGEVGNKSPVVTMDLTLQQPMTYQLFHYLVREDSA
ncbi:MAG TPA: DEAD/DEAH box helicase [Atopostipes sp.]|nr:DEAD/DEAH box helicase [Atopostipes sp.]